MGKKDKNVLTTGEVAEICHVSCKSVIKWFNGGLLKGYRIPGLRGDRRILPEDLIEFLRKYKIPYEEIVFKRFPHLKKTEAP